MKAIQAYVDAIADAGLLVERLPEPALPGHALGRPHSARWQRIPLFLHIRALEP